MPTIIYPATSSSGSSSGSNFFIIPKDSATEPTILQLKESRVLTSSSQDVTLSSGTLTINGADNYYRDITISDSGAINFTGTSPILRCRNLTVNNLNGLSNTGSTGPGFGDGFNLIANSGGQDRQVIQIICSGTITLQDHNTLVGASQADASAGADGGDGRAGPALYIKTGTFTLPTGKTLTVKGSNGVAGGAGGDSAAGGDGGNGGNAGYIEIELTTNGILGTIAASMGDGGAGGAGGARTLSSGTAGSGGAGGNGLTAGVGGAGGAHNNAGTPGNGGAGGNGYFTGGAGGAGGAYNAGNGNGGNGGNGGEGLSIGGAGGAGGNGAGTGTSGDGGNGGDGTDTAGAAGAAGTGGSAGSAGSAGDTSPETDFTTIAYGILKSSLDGSNLFIGIV